MTKVCAFCGNPNIRKHKVKANDKLYLVCLKCEEELKEFKNE